MSRLKEQSANALSRWVLWCHEHPLIILIGGLILTGAALFQAKGIKISTDTAGMISPELRYIQVYHEFKREFPTTTDNIVVVIDGKTPDLADRAVHELKGALEQKRDLMPWIYMPGGGEFFERNGLLFLDTDELERLSVKLAQAAPFLAMLTEHRDAGAFLELLDRYISSRPLSTGGGGKEGTFEQVPEIGLGPIFTELARTFKSAAGGEFYEFSWQRLLGPDGQGEDSSRRFLIVKPSVSYGQVLPGKEAIEAIRHEAARLGIGPERGVRLSLTGDIPMEYDELRSVTRGAKSAGILSFIMVTLVLVMGLGSVRLVTATVLPLLMGLSWTAAFASIAIGHLNMISVAFTVLFIGLSVDYAIHLCLRYRELIEEGTTSKEAVGITARQVGPSLLLCCLTTASAFYSFTPTDFAGVAELGIIAGTGIIIGLLANLSIIPALLSLFPLKQGKKRPYYMKLGNRPGVVRILTAPYRHSRIIRVLVLVALVAGIYGAMQVEFDSNPINLRDPDSESVRTFKRLIKEDPSPWALESMADQEEAALRRARAFSAISGIKRVVTLDSFIPEDQDEKLPIIEETYMILEPVLTSTCQGAEGLPETADAGPERDSPWHEELDRITAFVTRLKGLVSGRGLESPGEKEAAKELLEAMDAFLDRLSSQGPVARQHSLAHLDRLLFSGFGRAIERLDLALSTQGVTKEDLPAELVRQWIGSSGKWRIQVVPLKVPGNDEQIERFIQSARAVDPDVTGFPVQIIEGGRAVVRSFKEAFTLSFCFIGAIILIISRKKRDGMVVIFSLLATGIFTGALMELFGLQLNFANIIALPLIMGIGVDHGIHIVDRFRLVLEHPRAILQTSTSRAILFSSLTTICSFGNLAISPHAGMASMGKLLTLGIMAAYLCAVILVPAFLVSGNRSE